MKEINTKLKQVLDATKLKYEILGNTPPNKTHHYWYGGAVISLEYKDMTFSIEAIGDVRFALIDKERKETGEELFYVVDKNNSGRLGEELSYYIKDDTELCQLLSYEHPKYTCDISDNNWWECFAEYKGRFIDLMWCLDASTLEEAVEEVIEALPEAYKQAKES